MKKRIWLGALMAALVGVSACSSGITISPIETTATTTTTPVAVSGTALEGVEFIIHQAPG